MQELYIIQIPFAHNTKGITQVNLFFKRYKIIQRSCFILLKSWMLTPFKTYMHFSIELLWSTFTPMQDSPIDLMLKGDN